MYRTTSGDSSCRRNKEEKFQMPEKEAKTLEIIVRIKFKIRVKR